MRKRSITSKRQCSCGCASQGSRRSRVRAADPNAVLRETVSFRKLCYQRGTKLMSGVYLDPGHELWESLRVNFFHFVFIKLEF